MKTGELVYFPLIKEIPLRDLDPEGQVRADFRKFEVLVVRTKNTAGIQRVPVRPREGRRLRRTSGDYGGGELHLALFSTMT